MNIFYYPQRILNKFTWFARNFRDVKLNSELFHHVHGPLTYNTDGLATSNNADFITEPKFAKAYAAAAATQPWPNFTLQWRVYIVCWFANWVKNLEGDYVECGVNTGAYARAIIDYTDFAKTGKTFYLLDTFEGLDPSQITSQEAQAGVTNYLNAYTNVYDQVTKTFAPFNARIIKGRVPDTLGQVDARQIAYLSIDMNVTAPEIAAMEYFWDRIVSGGVLIHDDYGFPQHIHQKHAVDEFAARRGVNVLCLPTGQGIIIKP